MPAQTSPALTSGEIILPRKKNTSEKKRAHLATIHSLGGKKSAEVRQMIKRKRMLSEAKVLKAARQILLQNAEGLARAWLIPAFGSHFIYKKVSERDDKGRITRTEHIQLTDPREIGHALDCIANDSGLDEDNKDLYYYAVVKDPDFRAIVAAYDRMFGKAAESLKVSGEIKHFSLIALAKERGSLPSHDLRDAVANVLSSSVALLPDTSGSKGESS